MIELYRHKHCNTCDSVEEKLKEMVVAYKSVLVNAKNEKTLLKEKITIPLIKDGGEKICGKKEIKLYLEKLEKIVSDWRKFQSDSCYIDDDGEVC